MSYIRNKCIHDKQKQACIVCSPNSNSFCKICRLRFAFKHNNYLCAGCDPSKIKIEKYKEMRVFDLLSTNNYEFIHNTRVQNSIYIPDFLFICNNYYIILEVDEHAHSGARYPKNNEIIRMNKISSSLILPVKFIRYNPDNNKYDHIKMEAVLLNILDQYLNYCNEFDTLYLFYNTDDDMNDLILNLSLTDKIINPHILKNNSTLKNNYINYILKPFELSICSIYNGISGDNQIFKCLKFGHEFECSWDNIKQRRSCLKCNILKNIIPIYQYSLKTKILVKIYEDIDDVIKQNDTFIKISILYNCMNNPQNKSSYGFKWSFYKPDDNNKLNPENTIFTDYEQKILDHLNIPDEIIKINNKRLTPIEQDKRIMRTKKIYQFDKSLNLLNEYNNKKEASKAIGKNDTYISKVMKKYKIPKSFDGTYWFENKILTEEQKEIIAIDMSNIIN